MKKLLLIILIGLLFTSTRAQEKESLLSNMSLNGYVKYMNTVMFSEVDSFWLVDNLIHNRLNFKWYMNDNLTMSIEARNRFIYGDLVEKIPGYAQMIESDNGYLNFLTSNVIEEKSFLFNVSVDRAYFEFNKNNIVVTVGRQRINWGQSFAWNPNDIFNAYSFFDFDYEEKPGSDAVRVQYYPSYTSVADVAVKVDADKNVTAAGLYRFNKWGYDVQLLGGVLDTTDYVVGMGWSGSIQNAGFNGEATYFHPQKNFKDTSGVLLLSAGVNYMFDNSLYVQFEGIYNGYFEQLNLSGFNNLYFTPMSVKTISFSKFSWFGQLTYPIHPLLNTTIAAMYFPSLGNGYFLMPSLSYSVSNNFECALYGQYFNANFAYQNEEMTLLFLRFRYSF